MRKANLLFSLILVLFSCGPKDGRKPAGNTYQPDPNKPNNIRSVPAVSTSLDQLAAKMVASKDDYYNNGSTEAEERFIEAFIHALKQPGSFKADFSYLKKYEINVLTADDHKIRLFYWLSPYSGTMWRVQNIIQYQGGEEVTALSFNDLYEDKDDEGGPTPFFEHIYALNTSPQKTYLLTGYGQMSGTEPYSVSHTLVIDHSTFSINKPLFKSGNVLKSQLFASAYLGEGQDKDNLTGRLAMIYNAHDKTLSYPELSETKDGFSLNGKRKILTFRDGVFK